CLKQTHNAKLVKDLRNMTRRLTHQNTHQKQDTCLCNEMHRRRAKGCKNPHKCATTAESILHNLLPKYNPYSSPRKDDLTLMHRRLEKNVQARKQPLQEATFNPSITIKNSLSDGFCIFINPTRPIHIPAYCLHAPQNGQRTQNDPLTIFTDGSCMNNGKQDAKCRGGIWIANNHPLNRAISIPGTHHSNQIGELVAVLVALQSVNPSTPVKIMTDSKYVINGLTTHLSDWEDAGWIGVSNAPHFQSISIPIKTATSHHIFPMGKGP
ncbi:ribonuclease H-like domain-containing protein, partial [Suillus subalutaceus]|uniref:ribonuclease H-like domain-containing protein n=1 Tax=Suillus subalutaceus TaxID=48586 RepID=UPI001B8795E4